MAGGWSSIWGWIETCEWYRWQWMPNDPPELAPKIDNFSSSHALPVLRFWFSQSWSFTRLTAGRHWFWSKLENWYLSYILKYFAWMKRASNFTNHSFSCYWIYIVFPITYFITTTPCESFFDVCLSQKLFVFNGQRPSLLSTLQRPSRLRNILPWITVTAFSTLHIPFPEIFNLSCRFCGRFS